MTPESFRQWVEDMRYAKIARSGAECGRMLGVSPTTVDNWKRKGTDRATALACRALLHRLEPYV